MRKLSVFLVVLCLLGLCACKGEGEPKDNSSLQTQATASSVKGEAAAEPTIGTNEEKIEDEKSDGKSSTTSETSSKSETDITGQDDAAADFSEDFEDTSAITSSNTSNASEKDTTSNNQDGNPNTSSSKKGVDFEDTKSWIRVPL